MLVVPVFCLLSTPFYSQKCPSSNGTLHGHLIYKDLHDLDPAFPCMKIYAFDYASLKNFSIFFSSHLPPTSSLATHQRFSYFCALLGQIPLTRIGSLFLLIFKANSLF